MNKKKIIIGLGIIIFLCGVFFFGIHPIWLTVERDVTCTKSESVAESLEDWKDADDMDVNLDAFSGEFPSKDSLDYRKVDLQFTLTNTSIFGLQGMCVYVKDIDCENKKNAVLLKSYTYDEAGFELVRAGKETYNTPFILVYVGDLSSEEEIEERLEDIAKHTTYEVICSMEWLGIRRYTFCAGDKLNGYIIKNSYNGYIERIK